MTRVQALAKALKAKVVEDAGYRGILYNEQHGHMRYHISQGLQRVERTNRTWRTIETILSTTQIDEFLSESEPEGVRISTGQVIADQLGAVVVNKLQSGGLVMRIGEEFVRFSPVQGLDIVERALTKWVRKDTIFRLPALKKVVNEGRWEYMKERVDECLRERAEAVRADGGGSSSGSGEAEGAA
jgi:hypothetical protein